MKGQIFDDQTGKPLSNAAVFIANTTKGASTDRDGKFEIGGLYNIHYNLVVSYLGYKPVVVDLVAGSPIVYQIRLTPVSKVLKEVVIRSITEAQWRKYLADFKEHFYRSQRKRKVGAGSKMKDHSSSPKKIMSLKLLPTRPSS
ncbi:MAG: carboxypeptidase-like regulatory domain-containing protein [Bacteroidota bacterium]